jgi:chromosome segregation ATPase
VRTLR